MICSKCGGKVGSIPMKNIDGVKGYCYYCNKCHGSFWKSLDGSIEDSSDVRILGADMSPKACDYEILIDLVSFGVDIVTRDGKKTANDIADYLRSAGYNVSIGSRDRRASLIIDLKEESK